ncbi:hypothetical protein EI94DRAFT_1738830 [Lactarius quietus]|nr:hypothetical protein EI94DRAFT_1738830 [Lactarius quietus]
MFVVMPRLSQLQLQVATVQALQALYDDQTISAVAIFCPSFHTGCDNRPLIVFTARDALVPATFACWLTPSTAYSSGHFPVDHTS